MERAITGQLPNQSFHIDRVVNLDCSDCDGVVSLILNAQRGVSPRRANEAAIREFEDLMDDKLCREELTCLPLRRLRSRV